MVRGSGFKSLLNIDDALSRLLVKLKPLATEYVDVYSCAGRILAEDVYAAIDVPPFDRAAMDGYAVRAEDTFGASTTNPVMLEVVGSVEIGKKPAVTVERGKAVEIATGAPMPAGANAVVMVEHTRSSEGFVEVMKQLTPGKNVSMKGEDVKKGEIVLRRGEILQPQDAGILAACGVERVRVYRKPVVAVISTGNELVEVGSKLEYGKIYNSNNPMICNALLENKFEAVSLGIARDSEDEIEEKLIKALRYDAVIFTGGTSVGKKDLVPAVVERYGKIMFHGVAMKPGMPSAAAVVDGKPIFMLPGSPAAALLSFYTFVIPALYRMMNVKIVARKWSVVEGVLTRRVSSQLGIRSNVRVRWENGKVEPVRVSGSGILSSMVRANGLLIVPEEVEGFDEGEVVSVVLIRDVTEVFE